ncbi:MAG: hypothetical protein LBG06_08725, partial [Deltaproteobacteria bacterium]|nr:hypothetical protein [Deltaproteobacteria bacterium]
MRARARELLYSRDIADEGDDAGGPVALDGGGPDGREPPAGRSLPESPAGTGPEGGGLLHADTSEPADPAVRAGAQEPLYPLEIADEGEDAGGPDARDGQDCHAARGGGDGQGGRDTRGGGDGRDGRGAPGMALPRPPREPQDPEPLESPLERE